VCIIVALWNNLARNEVIFTVRHYQQAEARLATPRALLLSMVCKALGLRHITINIIKQSTLLSAGNRATTTIHITTRRIYACKPGAVQPCYPFCIRVIAEVGTDFKSLSDG
jgi:hypothetical protein